MYVAVKNTSTASAVQDHRLASSFTHYCFSIISANVNIVEKADEVSAVLLWK